MNTRYWLVRKTVCLVAYYGGLRTNEVRSIEFGKTFSGGEISFEQDDSGFWFTFERSKQRGATETTTICVPRRQPDWVPVVSDSFKSPSDYDPASIIDAYLELLESDYQKSREELTGPFFRSTHGVDGRKFVQLPLGVNMLAKVGVEFASQLFLPNALGYTSHCWRRSCGTNASNAGVNVTTLMAQLGWSTPKTALGYVRKSKITSLTMSTFLSNIQRQNKILDAGGVKSTPKGVQLSKSDNAPRSATKKLNPKVVTKSKVSSKPEDSSALVVTSDPAVSSDPEDEEDHSSFDEIKSQIDLSLRETNCSSGSSLQTEKSSSAHTESSRSTGSVIPSAETSFSVPVEFIDPRAAAILQNFQNNGNVQIHFHFNDKK